MMVSIGKEPAEGAHVEYQTIDCEDRAQVDEAEPVVLEAEPAEEAAGENAGE